MGKDTLQRATAVKVRYESALMSRPGVVGVGVGLRQRRGALTEEVCLVVMVSRKRPPADLPPADALPTELDGVPIDVQEAGDIAANSRLKTRD